MNKIYTLRNTNFRFVFATLIFSFLFATSGKAQNIALETFPNEFNPTFFPGPGGPFIAQDLGNWQFGATDAEASIAVTGPNFVSSPYGLILANFNNTVDSSLSFAFSPIIDLSTYAGSSSITIGFSINASDLDPANTCLFYRVQVYNAALSFSTIWQKTAAQIVTDHGTTWDTVMVTIPSTYLTNDFQLVLLGNNGPTCNTSGNELLFIDNVRIFDLTLLPVTLRSFNVSYSNKTATLKWTVSEETSIESYSVERSRDGRTFETVGSVTANGGTAYQYADNLSSFTGNTVLYRLAIKEATGAKKYSNIVNVRLNSTGKGIQLSPNPAKSSTTIRVLAAKQGDITIRLMNVAGKTVKSQTQKVASGINSIQLSNLEALQSGLYTVHVIVDDEIFVEKLIINK